MEFRDHNTFPKIAVVNDITGFGKCSITVALPIISHMGIQCNIVPTSILSNHSAYESFFFQDYGEYMEEYLSEWKKLSLTFDGILTGFFGSARQIDAVTQMIKDFSTPDTRIIVDPIMGDDGMRYSTYNDELCNKIRELVREADLITPNLTELCILADKQYREYSVMEIGDMCEELSGNLKPDCKIVVTGIREGDHISNIIYENKKLDKTTHKVSGNIRCGTGDVFSAIVAANEILGVKFYDSVNMAGEFICKCIEASDRHEIPFTDGVCFEEVLKEL